MTPEQIRQHNESVAALNADFAEGRNGRVPITIASDEALWLKLAGRTFREYYTDPRAQLEVTLLGVAWCAENLVHDAPIGLPDSFVVAPRWWMDEPELLGCEVTIQENDFAWPRPLGLPKADLLNHVRSLDPVEAVRGSRLWRLYCDMRALAGGMAYRDRPVQVIPPIGTHGVFTVAGLVRGNQELCIDMHDDPEFAYEFIGAVTDHTVARIKAWHDLAETGVTFPQSGGWGSPDDAIQLLSPAAYRTFVLPHHERLYSAFTTGPRSMHLCGFAGQHYSAIYHDLFIRTLDGPGPWVDYGQVLADCPELVLVAQPNHTELVSGSVGSVEAMMRAMVAPAAKQPGRFRIVGFIGSTSDLGLARALYDAGVRYGETGAQGK